MRRVMTQEGEQDNKLISLQTGDKEAQELFDFVWAKIQKEYGDISAQFPKKIFLLNGSPGAGKGTHTDFIRKQCKIEAQPVVVSALLNEPSAKKCKDEGVMVNDEYVTYSVFCKLIDPVYREGIIVDGYPRTKIQADCIRLLYQKINARHNASQESFKDSLKKSSFNIIVLFVDEKTSVERQLKRGKENQSHNDKVRASNQGFLKEVRKTDSNIEDAHKRYRIFKTVTYESLKSLQNDFPFHEIKAFGSIAEVQRQITEKLGNIN